MDPGSLGTLLKYGEKLWKALDGRNALKGAIVLILGVLGLVCSVVYDIKEKVGAIPKMAEARNLELADMKRRDDHEDKAIEDHDRIIAETVHNLHALAEVTADLRGQVTILIRTVFADRGGAAQSPGVHENFQREKR